MTQIIESLGLTKSYGDRIVVDKVDLKLKGGNIFGLFGPNGSGKTTILRMLTGLTRPSMGKIQFTNNGNSVNLKKDPLFVRKHCAILTETPTVYENMELFNYLRFFAKLSSLKGKDISKRILEVVSIVSMEDHLYSPLRKMSMGERQRVEIARVLLKDSPVLFLDEPFNGIDITTRREIRNYLRSNWLNKNRSIFYTSHNLVESENFIDSFAFIHRGKIIASGNKNDFMKNYQILRYKVRTLNTISAQKGLESLAENNLIESGEVANDFIFVKIKKGRTINELIRRLVENNVSFQEATPAENIEDVFIRKLQENEKKEGFM